jgi:hypothetical protein
MPSPGKALAVWDAPLFDIDDMIGRLDVPGGAADDLVNDYVWGASLYPVRHAGLHVAGAAAGVAAGAAVNSMSVSRRRPPAYAVNTASRDEYGTFDPGAVTLETALDADPLAWPPTPPPTRPPSGSGRRC